ncbi:tyrosine-protein phosphatase [Kitasatospora sp. McL0602]|uniref:tyrosine-protein phosphatase n=1 Tax=Kitasatospora sp. McL0602 TaxID=3439530 RepID=UPI003F88AF61
MTERASDAPSPLLDVQGVLNLRDAGITGLRPGLLYRSSHLAALTPAGARRLEELGLRTVVDLRTPTELALLPDRRHHLGFDHYHHPVLPDHQDGNRAWPDNQTAMYRFMAEDGAQAIADTVRLLATPGALPALIHCAVGKDRTGLTIAILQTLAGAPTPAVLADFLRSNPALGLDTGPRPYIDEHGNEGISHPVAAHLLETSLTHIHTHHPTLDAYLHHHGVTPAELTALRALLAG